MTYEDAIRATRTRIEALIRDMDEAEAAELLERVEGAVRRHSRRRLGEAIPFGFGTPEHDAFHAAVGASIELPVDMQDHFCGQAATLLTVIARETREMGGMVDEAITSTARRMADGKRVEGQFPLRILRRIRTELLAMLEAETDKARVATAIASFLGSVRDADIKPDRDTRTFVDESFVVLNGPVSRSSAGLVYKALDGATRNWMSSRMAA